MKHLLLYSVVIAALFDSSRVMAVTPVESSPFDYRIKSVVYNAEDTVALNAVLGIQIHIKVGKDEKYITHAFGDTKAWQFSHSGNNYFVRPTADLSDTNLVIITDKHTYNILLHFIGHSMKKQPDGTMAPGFINSPWAMKQATIELNYQYPEEALAAAKAAIAKQDLQKAMDRKDTSGPHNIDYQMSSDPSSTSIAPANVWDNFQFTYFKFAENAELPTIFLIGSDGKESTPNTHVEGPDHNIIVAETTAKQWRIRYGLKKVVGVVNNDYNPSLGANSSGTVIPGFQRMKKSEDQQ